MKTLIVCDCHSLDHSIVLEYVPDTNPAWDSLTLSLHLRAHGFWKRLKIAFLYILGRGHPYGAWEEVLLNDEQARDFRAACDRYLDRYIP